jgi:hypothetical protein
MGVAQLMTQVQKLDATHRGGSSSGETGFVIYGMPSPPQRGRPFGDWRNDSKQIKSAFIDD